MAGAGADGVTPIPTPTGIWEHDLTTTSHTLTPSVTRPGMLLTATGTAVRVSSRQCRTVEGPTVDLTPHGLTTQSDTAGTTQQVWGPASLQWFELHTTGIRPPSRLAMPDTLAIPVRTMPMAGAVSVVVGGSQWARGNARQFPLSIAR